MILCKVCGAEVGDGETLCPKCGAQVEPQPVYQPPQAQEYQQPAAQQPAYQPQAQGYQQPPQQPAYQPQAQGYQQPPPQQPGYQYQPHSHQYQQQPYAPSSPEVDAQQNKWLAMSAYLIFFLPLLAAPNSKFARYHSNQGLITVIFMVALWIVRGILSVILYSALGWSAYRIDNVVGSIVLLAQIGLWVLGILGIVNAANGKTKPVPLIGSIFTIIK
jgi:uncharacterized membrane protein